MRQFPNGLCKGFCASHINQSRYSILKQKSVCNENLLHNVCHKKWMFCGISISLNNCFNTPGKGCVQILHRYECLSQWLNSSLSSDHICSMIWLWAGWSFSMVFVNHTIYGLGAVMMKNLTFFKFDIKSFFNSYSSYDKFQPSWTITLCISKVPLLLFSSCHISLFCRSFDKFSVIEMQLHSIFILFQIFSSHNLVFTLNAFYLMLLPSWNAPLCTPKECI